jgi:hypothetical protein
MKIISFVVLCLFSFVAGYTFAVASYAVTRVRDELDRRKRDEEIENKEEGFIVLNDDIK